jgi:hypothetical protein
LISVIETPLRALKTYTNTAAKGGSADEIDGREVSVGDFAAGQIEIRQDVMESEAWKMLRK